MENNVEQLDVKANMLPVLQYILENDQLGMAIELKDPKSDTQIKAFITIAELNGEKV